MVIWKLIFSISDDEELNADVGGGGGDGKILLSRRILLLLLSNHNEQKTAWFLKFLNQNL